MVVTAATVVVTAATVGVIEDIGASAPTAIAMAIVRIVDMAQLVRPRGMAAAGLIHTTTHIRAFVAPLAGIMAPAASMALGSTVAGDTPTGDIAAATVAVCTGDGRSPCGAGTAGASPAAEDRQRLLSACTGGPADAPHGELKRLIGHRWSVRAEKVVICRHGDLTSEPTRY